jgi:thioredoxin reductase (NADPH)
MLVRGDRLSKSMSAYLIERIERHPLIDVCLETELTELNTTAGKLTAVTFTDRVASPRGRTWTASSSASGVDPTPSGAPGSTCSPMPRGYILTGQDILTNGAPPGCWPLERDPLPLETTRVGLFAAGDVRHGSTKRVAAAVGEGSMVASLIFSRLAELGVTY